MKKKPGFDFMVDIMDMLSAPIITYNPQWMSKVPEKLSSIITTQRMIYALKHIEEATDAEVVAYLMTAANTFPLNHEWYEIMMECFYKTMPEEAKIIDPEHRPLDSYKRDHLLKPLKISIYKARRKIMKQRVMEYDYTGVPDETPHVESKIEQLNLFE